MQAEAGETEYLRPEPQVGSEAAGCHRRRTQKESLNLLPSGEEVWLGSNASQPLPGVKRERAGVCAAEPCRQSAEELRSVNRADIQSIGSPGPDQAALQDG